MQRRSLSTSWKSDGDESGSVRAVPQEVLIPLYHKIRIPYQLVQRTVVQFDRLLEALRDVGMLSFCERLLWDVYLTDVNTFKAEVWQAKGLTAEQRTIRLCRSLPKFIWRATALDGGMPVLDLLFDATDIEQGNMLTFVPTCDERIASVVRTVTTKLPGPPSELDSEGWTIMRRLAES